MRNPQLLLTWIPAEPKVARRLLSRSSRNATDTSCECLHVIGSCRDTKGVFFFCRHLHNTRLLTQCTLFINQIRDRGIYGAFGTTSNEYDAVCVCSQVVTMYRGNRHNLTDAMGPLTSTQPQEVNLFNGQMQKANIIL